VKSIQTLVVVIVAHYTLSHSTPSLVLMVGISSSKFDQSPTDSQTESFIRSNCLEKRSSVRGS
jgi:hypothetical protein